MLHAVWRWPWLHGHWCVGVGRRLYHCSRTFPKTTFRSWHRYSSSNASRHSRRSLTRSTRPAYSHVCTHVYAHFDTQGDEGYKFYLILKGKVKVVVDSQHVVVERGEGECFGEVDLPSMSPPFYFYLPQFSFFSSCRCHYCQYCYRH